MTIRFSMTRAEPIRLRWKVPQAKQGECTLQRVCNKNQQTRTRWRRTRRRTEWNSKNRTKAWVERARARPYNRQYFEYMRNRMRMWGLSCRTNGRVTVISSLPSSFTHIHAISANRHQTTFQVLFISIGFITFVPFCRSRRLCRLALHVNCSFLSQLDGRKKWRGFPDHCSRMYLIYDCGLLCAQSTQNLIMHATHKKNKEKLNHFLRPSDFFSYVLILIKRRKHTK